MITTRFATLADAELIATLSRQTFYETFAAFNTKENIDQFMNQQFTLEDLVKEVRDRGNIFFVAYEGETPLGYVRMRESKNPPGLAHYNSIEIARIYAVSNAIGKGVGKLLMQQCMDIALEKKKDVIWLGVWEHNHRAIDFYTKWGFEKFGIHEFILGSDIQTDWLMKKIL